MKVSEEFIKAVKTFEGCKLKAYWDKTGCVWTIGYGHTKDVKKDQTITEAQALKYLYVDIQNAEEWANALKICNTQGQFDAVVDFIYNVGIGNFLRSTLFKKIKANAPVSEIQIEFRKWNKSGRKVLPGLTKRREWEAQQWAK